MKAVLLPILLLFAVSTCAQANDPSPSNAAPVVRTGENVVVHAHYPVYFTSNGQTLTLQYLRENGFDRLSIFDVRGQLVRRTEPVTNGSRVDISQLDDGVYLLVFRSSETLREKAVKFVVRRS